MKRLTQNQNGFTLVELIVVIALLSILAIIAITTFAGITDSTRLQADYYLASAITSSAQAWIAESDHSYNKDSIDIEKLKKDNYLLKKCRL